MSNMCGFIFYLVVTFIYIYPFLLMYMLYTKPVTRSIYMYISQYMVLDLR